MDLERRRGKDVPRTYRSLDRRVKALIRRLRARGIQVCFLQSHEASPCCSQPEDAHLWLAEEQIRSSLAKAGCCWKHCEDSPTEALKRLVQKDPRIAAMFGVENTELSPAAAEWLVGSKGITDNEDVLHRLALLADDAPQPPGTSSEACEAVALNECLGDARGSRWRQVQGSPLGIEGSLLQLAAWLQDASIDALDRPLLEEICALPMEARAWLLERARVGGISETWIQDWAQLAQQLIKRGDWRSLNLQGEQGLASAATFLLARSAPLMEEELEALAWTLELMKPRQGTSILHHHHVPIRHHH